MTPTKTFGAFVRELREGSNLSLRGLAKRIDVSPPFLSDIELGRRYPSAPTLKRLSKALNVPVAEFKQYDPRCSMEELRIALDESVGLQAHYAKQLNVYDGGHRHPFKSGKEWIARLRETGTLPKHQ